VKRYAGRTRCSPQPILRVAVIGTAHVNEAFIAGLAEERRGAREVDVIGNHHRGARRHVGANAAGGVGA
jgi:hypothetical protein